MNEEIAKIVAIKGESLVIESEIKSSCSGCQQVDSCASGQVAKAIPHRKLTVELNSNLALQVGDSVVIGIPENNVLSSAVQVYAFPILGLIFGSAIGQYLLMQNVINHELIALALGGVLGFAGFKLAKYRLSSPENQKQLNPVILRKLK